MKAILKEYEARITAWASSHPAIDVAIVCGSTARQINPADEWADLDVELYVNNFTEFLSNMDWLNHFGSIWTHLRLQEASGPVILAVYNDGEKIDFHFFLVEELEMLVSHQKLHSSYERGYRVIIDKNSRASKLPQTPIGIPSIEKPSETEFAFQINAFWYGALYVAKQICRRNLWVVKFRDWTIKQTLLTMMEWYAQSQYEWNIDTWHDGHFMSQWINSQIFEALHQTFGHFDADDSWGALLATMGLFSRVGQDLARNLDYRYPLDLDTQITHYIQNLHNTDTP